jgi:acyl-coenzyme A synthetase/AMP-(fatty) acid ligase
MHAEVAGRRVRRGVPDPPPPPSPIGRCTSGQRIAGALHALGLRRGVLALEMPNWMEACLTYLGAAHLGLNVLPIIHIYRAKEVEFILRQSGAKAFMTPDSWSGIDYLATLSEIRDRLPEL